MATPASQAFQDAFQWDAFQTGVVVGDLAATETPDGFAGTGVVGDAGYLAATESPDTFAATGEVIPQPSPVPPGGFGDYADAHKKARKKRDEELKREKEEKERLRRLIAEAIDPSLKEANTVEVAAEDGVVEVKPDNAPAFRIDIPALVDSSDAYQIVMQALERAQVAATKVIERNEAARQREIQRREQQRIAKRKRDDELLMLMD